MSADNHSSAHVMRTIVKTNISKVTKRHTCVYWKFLRFPYFVPSMKDQDNIGRIEQYVIDYVRELRVTNNLLQEDIASILGTTKAFISNAESTNHRAKYNLKHIDKLAQYFNLSPRDFLPEKTLQ